ncbi:hypothetical protein CH341_19790 [Rhodoplanes roseus]|uniref:DUF2970 domain-containing protein n=1 Tax=Rhodoplanes roseus TaxID=29409 RepID=A0A327KYW2_9BRAD|nr:hypothetical protein CH341_19790 [Rhodoplanes roseus]
MTRIGRELLQLISSFGRLVRTPAQKSSDSKNRPVSRRGLLLIFLLFNVLIWIVLIIVLSA